MLDVRVNKIDENMDEVFIYREEPYVNRAIYAKTGLFKTGKLSDKAIAELEEQSAAALAKDRADADAAEQAALAKAAKEPEPKAKAPKGE